MKLTQTECGMLWNQFDVLQKLGGEEETSHYKRLKLIIERGFEAHYNEVFSHIFPDDQVLTPAESQEVRDILEMFQRMGSIYPDLHDKEGINAEWVRFSGFSLSEEAKQYHYAEFLLEEKQYDIPPGHNLDAHLPILSQYRKMVAEWKKGNRGNLSKADLVRITNASES